MWQDIRIKKPLFDLYFHIYLYIYIIMYIIYRIQIVSCVSHLSNYIWKYRAIRDKITWFHFNFQSQTMHEWNAVFVFTHICSSWLIFTECHERFTELCCFVFVHPWRWFNMGAANFSLMTAPSKSFYFVLHHIFVFLFVVDKYEIIGSVQLLKIVSPICLIPFRKILRKCVHIVSNYLTYRCWIQK